MSLFNNIKKILLGNGAAQLIQFAFLPLSAFLYTPNQFGVFGTIQAYSTILTIFISLQLYVAIPFEKNQLELNNLKNLNFKYIVFSTIFLLILYSIFNIDYFSILAIFLASITAVTNTLRSLIVYSGNFTRLSTSYVIRALVIVISQTALSFNTAINGLIYGLLLGEIIYSGLLHYFIKRSVNLPNLNIRSFFKVSIVDIFSKYRAFSLYGSILELTSALIFYGPIFIFSYFFNHNLIGQYSFIARLIWPPIILVATSCSNALYFHFKEIDKDKLKSLTLKTTVFGIFILLLSPVFAWLGEKIISLFLKAEAWDLVADFGYFIILTAMSYMASICARAIIRFKHLQKYQLLIDILFISGLALAILIYMNVNSNSMKVFEVLKLYSISYLIYNFVLIASVAIFIYSARVIKRDGS